MQQTRGVQHRQRSPKSRSPVSGGLLVAKQLVFVFNRSVVLPILCCFVIMDLSEVRALDLAVANACFNSHKGP